MNLSPEKIALVDALRSALGVDVVSRQQLLDFCETHPEYAFPNWLTNDPTYRAHRGHYRLPVTQDVPAEAVAAAAGEADSVVSPKFAFNAGESLVPKPLSYYIPFGNHADIKAIIASRKFAPVFISGLSGCGKTTTIRQVCSELKRECFRVNITCETDEDDLLGGFRLVSGETKFHYGPVIEAMKRGAVLLLDEVDLASSKVMCLQPILEGSGVFLKKINEFVTPAPGFQIIATANTKGQGSETGKFVGTNVMNEAFLDRFAMTMDQEYPQAKVEAKILNKLFAENNVTDNDFVDKLVSWANVIRKSYDEQALDEVISTRRLVHAAETYCIFEDRMKAIEMTTRRFNAETRKSMIDLYSKIDSSVANNGVTVPDAPKADKVVVPDGEIPF